MKSATTHSSGKLPTTFNALCALHPPRPIGDAIDLANAHRMIDRLAVLNRRTEDQNDYLETLVLLTEAYEAHEINDALDLSKSTPLDALKHLMDVHGMKQVSLAKILKIGSSAVSMILSGQRPLTADHARRLATHFGISAGAFI